MSGTPRASPIRARAVAFSGPLGLAVAFAALSAWSWRAWPDPLVDFGRELYTPWQLSLGAGLYVDVAWFNGPLSAWWNAGLFRLFGAGFDTLALSNLALLAGITALLHPLLVRLAGRVSAALGCAVLLGVFGFGQYAPIGNYNFVAPYSHELTHGFALSIAALACCDRACRRSSLWLAAAAGLFLGLAFLTKPEPFAAGAAAVLVRGACLLATDAAQGRRLAFALVPLAAAAVPIGGAFAGLAAYMEPGDAALAVLGAWPQLFSGELRALAFYQAGLGLDRPWERFGELAGWSFGYGLVFGVPGALAARLPRGRGSLASVGLPLLVFAVLSSALLALSPRIDWYGVARPLPLIAIGVAVQSFVALFRARDAEAHARAALRLAFAVFAATLLAKLGLNARVVHYGFVLALPATLLLVALVVGWIPDWLAARHRAGGIARAAALAVLCVFVAAHLAESNHWFASKRYTVGSGRDAFRASARGALAQQAVREITERLPPEGTLLVLPEGVMLNYLARRASPTPYLNFMPPELILFGETEMLARLHDHPPDLVAIVHKDTSEYGYRFFGEDYARELGAWVASHYRPVHQIGHNPLVSERFGIALLEPRRGR